MSTRDDSAPPSNCRTQPATTRHELELAKTAARAAGEILRGYYRDGGYKLTRKAAIIRSRPPISPPIAKLRKCCGAASRPMDGCPRKPLTIDARLQCQRAWIVDPLDGTKEFIKGVPEFVVAIALTDHGVPVMGVSYNPIKDEMFSGIVGCGLLLQRRTRPRHCTASLEQATILASRSETSRGEWKPYESKVIVRSVGSVAYKLALVAAGQADATFTRSPKSEWDIAAGVALIIAAGGNVTDINGDEVRFNKPSVKFRAWSAQTAICMRNSKACCRTATPNSSEIAHERPRPSPAATDPFAALARPPNCSPSPSRQTPWSAEPHRPPTDSQRRRGIRSMRSRAARPKSSTMPSAEPRRLRPGTASTTGTE